MSTPAYGTPPPTVVLPTGGEPRRISLRAFVLVLALFATIALGSLYTFMNGLGGSNTPPKQPNLSISAAAVTCGNAVQVQQAFAQATSKVLNRDLTGHEAAKPDYTGVVAFGFRPPTDLGEFARLQAALKERKEQIASKVATVKSGACKDEATDTITLADGQTVVVPAVIGGDPANPMSGAQSNQDSRTIPLTIGTPNDKVRTDSWGSLNAAFGGTKWYTDCADSYLGMSWGADVPKFTKTEATPGTPPTRFILAVNTDSALTDPQIRQRAADAGNPDTAKLQVIRTDSILNTRHLESSQCDPFGDHRSMIRVSLGKVLYNEDGSVKGIETSRGTFVDCHNLWQIPKTPPKSPPAPSRTTTPPQTTPPGTTPPTTTPPRTCSNGGKPPLCLQPKDPKKGPVAQGNVPTQVQGKNPPAPKTTEPKPAPPPSTHYTPPAPPKTTSSSPPRTTPPPEPPAPPPSAPATGCVPPPGMQTC